MELKIYFKKDFLFTLVMNIKIINVNISFLKIQSKNLDNNSFYYNYNI